MKNLFRSRSIIRLFCLLSIVLSLSSAPVYAETLPQSTDQKTFPQIDQLLSIMSKDPNSSGARVGMAVYNTTKNEWVYQSQPDQTFVPASNLKLYVSATALDQLGPSDRIKTELYTTGKITPQGVLQGDVYLKGYGDPSLTTDDLTSMTQELKQKGIHAIHGQIFVDDSYYDDVKLGEGWMWDDELSDYSAQVSALSINRNVINVQTAPSSLGQAPTITMNPDTSYLTIQNDATTVPGTANRISLERPRGTNTLLIKGEIGIDAKPDSEDVTMDDPALYVGTLFKQVLQSNGIDTQKVTKEISRAAVPNQTPIITHESEPLSELIIHLNKQSDNLYAEMLIKQLGKVVKQEGSFDAGAEVIKEFMAKAGSNTDYMQVDGSGLSRLDLISPNQITQLLTYVSKQSYGQVFKQSLPIAGVDGTLSSRMKGTPAQGNVTAKTGSMSGVNGISGYVTAKNGDQLAFSIFINGLRSSRPATTFQDAVAVLLTQYPDILQSPSTYIPDTYYLSNILDPILDQPSLKGVASGVYIGSLDRKPGEQILYQRGADQLLTPASNLKLLTGMTALHELGEDYRIPTELYGTTAPDSKGTINGDLIIKGYGDPSLQTSDPSGQSNGTKLSDLVQQLRDQGITRINGNIRVDDQYFDGQRLGTGWAWDDETYGYNPSISALSTNRSSILLQVSPNRQEGKSVELSLSPVTDYMQIQNDATTGGISSPNTLTIEKVRGKNIIMVKGSLPLDAKPVSQRLAVEDPQLYTGSLFKAELESAGIKLDPKAEVLVGNVDTSDTKLATISSPPLKDFVTYMEKNSDNFYAEMLLKQLGKQKSGVGSASAGVTVVKNYLSSLGISPSFTMVDGSGLSRYDLVSAKQIGSFLEKITKEPNFSLFQSSLPIAGIDGTLTNRMQHTQAQGNVIAKTGTLSGVSGLSGYVTTKDGEHLYFSILMNGYTASSSDLTKAQDQIAQKLAELTFQ